MNERELNKKLAEWAGFKFWGGNTVEWVGDDGVTGILDPMRKGGYYIESEMQLNFTQSLDACFKWLVPKVNKSCKSWMLLPARGDWFQFQYILNESLDWVNSGHQETASLAFCLAIKKLINSEVANAPSR